MNFRPLSVCMALLLAAAGTNAAEKKPAKPASPTPAYRATDKKVAPATPAPVKRGPDEANDVAKHAMSAFQKGDLDTAKKDFLRVLELAPQNTAALINLGLIAQRQKNLPDAEKCLREAVRHDPESAAAWLVLGIVQQDESQLDAALASLAMAVSLAPKDARAHHYLGVVVGRKGWYSAAEDEMRKAIEIDPDYAEAHYNLSIFYLQRVPPAIELARRHYQKAVDLGAESDPQVEKQISETEPK